MSAEYLKPSPESPAAITTRPSITVSMTKRPSGESVHEHTWASCTVGSRSMKLRVTRAETAAETPASGTRSTSSSSRSSAISAGLP